MRTNVERSLFVELLGGVGDLLAVLPAMHAVARTYPRARHDVLTFAAGAELLACDPFIDRIHVAEPGRGRVAVEQLLAHERYDLVVSDSSSEDIDRLVTGCGASTAVANLWLRPPGDVRVADGFLELLRADGVVGRDVGHDARLYLTAAERAATAGLRRANHPLVALLLDAGLPIKRWPVERFAAVARALRRRYAARFLIVPGTREAEGAALAAALDASAQVCRRSSLRRLAASLAQADLAIGADTAPCGLAAAVGTPTITVFGPSWHRRHGQPEPHVNLQGGAACAVRRVEDFTAQPCWHTGQCPIEGCDSCVEDVSSEDVLRAAKAYLEGGAHGLGKPSSAASDRAAVSAQAVAVTDSARGWEPSNEIRRPLHARLRLPPLRRGARDGDWRRVRRLLVVRADEISDVILAGPAIRALKRALPEAALTLLASPAGAGVAPLLPSIDTVIAWRVTWQDRNGRAADPASERRLIATLEAHRFDGVVVLTSFSQSPHPAACAAWLAGIPLRAGASRERSPVLTHPLPPGDAASHQALRNLELVRALGFEADGDELRVRVPDGARCGADALLAAHGLPPGQPYLLLNPWTSAAARTYDPARLVRAAKLVSAAAGLPVVVTGHRRDAVRTAALVERIGPAAVDTCGETKVTELAALVARARLVLTNNTSVMHLADALGTPTVVLFAGTELESQWAPRHTPHRVLRRPTSCRPCYAGSCPLDHACLDIEPADVVDAALELLTSTAGDRGSGRSRAAR